MPIGLIIKNFHFSTPVQKPMEKPVDPPKPEAPKRPILHLKNGKK
jgi:hypothetical protein